MISALASGRLVSAVTFGQTKSERPYARCTIACDVGGESDVMVGLFVMDPESIAALGKAQRGDQIAAQGSLSMNSYTSKEGVERHGLSLSFARVLTVAPPKREKPDNPSQAQYRAAARSQRTTDEFPEQEPWL